jgi:hypothetical protein
MGDKETLKREYRRAAGRAAEQDAAPDAYREGLEDIENMNLGILKILFAVTAGIAAGALVWYVIINFLLS